MVTPFDVPANKLINAVKEELKEKEELETPEWALFVKTGVSRERPPEQADFWQIRAASLLRKLYMKGPLGVSKLRTEYGGKESHGSNPEKHTDGSGKIIRNVLQQLEKTGFVKKEKRKGRMITPEGQKFLDSIAEEIKEE